MDDLYAINTAKTEFRRGFNLADVSRILAIADQDLVSFSGQTVERHAPQGSVGANGRG